MCHSGPGSCALEVAFFSYFFGSSFGINCYIAFGVYASPDSRKKLFDNSAKCPQDLKEVGKHGRPCIYDCDVGDYCFYESSTEDPGKNNYFCSGFMTMDGGYCDQSGDDDAAAECKKKYSTWKITAKTAEGDGLIAFETTSGDKQKIYFCKEHFCNGDLLGNAGDTTNKDSKLATLHLWAFIAKYCTGNKNHQ